MDTFAILITSLCILILVCIALYFVLRVILFFLGESIAGSILIYNEDAAAVKKLHIYIYLKGNVNIRTMCHLDSELEEDTLLCHASWKGCRETVSVLLKARADVNASNKSGSTPLLLASKMGHAEIVKLLIEEGAEVNAKTTDGLTALWIASENGHVEIVRLLLNTKVDVNIVNKDGISPLWIASQKGHTQVVRSLLEAKAEVDVRNIEGATPLLIASQENYTEVVKLLLEAKADMNGANVDGITPLIAASQKGHAEIVKLLLEAKTHKNDSDEKGHTTPLIAPVSSKFENVNPSEEHNTSGELYTDTDKLKSFSELMVADKIENIGELIKAGADVNVKNKYGSTPLFMAAMEGRTAIVKFLLKSKADVNIARNADGATPLMAASWTGHIEVVKLLLEAGADVNAPVTDGATPLWKSAQSGHTKIVKLLLEAGADANAADKNGVTPLWIAARDPHPCQEEIVRLLLEAGADVNAANKDRITPLFIAKQKGRSEVVKQLKEAGGKQAVSTWDRIIRSNPVGLIAGLLIMLMISGILEMLGVSKEISFWCGMGLGCLTWTKITRRF